jgi:hypothetical protein
MLPPPQQLLRKPIPTVIENAVHTWDTGMAAEARDLLRSAVRAAADFGYL